MTEQEWLACADPEPMLGHLGDRLDARRRRLFGCACCRRQWDLLGRGGRKAVRAAELWAHDQSDPAALRGAWQAALCDGFVSHMPGLPRHWSLSRGDAAWFARRAAVELVNGHRAERAARNIAAAAAVQVTGSDRDRTFLVAGVGSKGPYLRHWAYAVAGELAVRRQTAALQDAWSVERRAQTNLLRCLAGWRAPPACPAEWRSGDVLGLVQAIYEDRAFDRFPLLADALMDAGCDDELVLQHARSEGHVPGCWLIDLVLGRD